MVFDRCSILRKPCASQSFPSDKTAGVFLKDLKIQFFDVHCGLFMGLHFSIGGYDYRWTPRFRQSIHCSRIQVLVADHVHWRSGIDNNFSFLRFQRWCKRAPIFRWREECCFFMLLEFYYIFGHLPRCFAGTFLLPLSPLETDPQILKRWGHAQEVHLGKYIRANDFGVEFWYDVQ